MWEWTWTAPLPVTLYTKRDQLPINVCTSWRFARVSPEQHTGHVGHTSDPFCLKRVALDREGKVVQRKRR